MSDTYLTQSKKTSVSHCLEGILIYKSQDFRCIRCDLPLLVGLKGAIQVILSPQKLIIKIHLCIGDQRGLIQLHTGKGSYEVESDCAWMHGHIHRSLWGRLFARPNQQCRTDARDSKMILLHISFTRLINIMISMVYSSDIIEWE